MKEETRGVLDIILQNKSIDWDKPYLFSNGSWHTYRELTEEVQKETEYGLHIVANIKRLQTRIALKTNETITTTAL